MVCCLYAGDENIWTSLLGIVPMYLRFGRVLVIVKTHISFVLDSSGSMSEIQDDTKGGFNNFLVEQQDEDGTATVSLHNFSTMVECVYEGKPVEEAPELDDSNYRPSGSTALHDAVVTAIDAVDRRISGLDASEKPDNVIVVVLTDGKENASETSHETVREAVESHQEKGWEFLFIGANQDAALEAGKMGVDSDNSLDMQYSGEGTQSAYDSTSERISEVRQTGSTNGFTADDREQQNRSE